MSAVEWGVSGHDNLVVVGNHASTIALQTPQSGGFVSAVDHSEGLKANLEEEGALLQDFHIVFTCKVRRHGNAPPISHPGTFILLAASSTCALSSCMLHPIAHSTTPVCYWLWSRVSPLFFSCLVKGCLLTFAEYAAACRR